MPAELGMPLLAAVPCLQAVLIGRVLAGVLSSHAMAWWMACRVIRSCLDLTPSWVAGLRACLGEAGLDDESCTGPMHRRPGASKAVESCLALLLSITGPATVKLDIGVSALREGGRSAAAVSSPRLVHDHNSPDCRRGTSRGR